MDQLVIEEKIQKQMVVEQTDTKEQLVVEQTVTIEQLVVEQKIQYICRATGSTTHRCIADNSCGHIWPTGRQRRLGYTNIFVIVTDSPD